MSLPDVFASRRPHISSPPWKATATTLYWGLHLKVIQNVDKGCWIPNTSGFHMQSPSQSNSKCQTGTPSKRLWHSRMQFFFFPQERQSRFSCNFISSRGVSRIQYNIKFLACLFNLRNCKNDDRWHTELTYVLYSLLKKGAHRNFDNGGNYRMQVAIKIIQWLSGQLGSEHSGFFPQHSLKPTNTVVGCHWWSQSLRSVPSCPNKDMMDVPLALNLGNLWNYHSFHPNLLPPPLKIIMK